MIRILAVCMSICVLTAAVIAQDSPKTAASGNPLALQVRDVSFQSKLSDAIDRLAELSGCRFDVDWASLLAAGVKPDDKVALRVPQATVEQLIDVVLSKAAKGDQLLAWRQTSDGVVRISTQAKILANGRTIYVNSPTAAATVRPAKTAASVVPAPTRAREITFDNAPLSDVLTFLKESAGVNIHVNWTALALVNIDKNTPVSLNISRISAAKAMDLIFDDLNAGKGKLDCIYWVIDGGVVTISTGTSLDQETRIRSFDIGDQLHVSPDFVSPRMNLSSGNQNTGNTGNNASSIWANTTTTSSNSGNPNEEQSTAEMRKELRDNIVNALKDSIGPDMWQPTGKGNVQLYHNKLIVSQSLLGFKLMEKAVSR